MLSITIRPREENFQKSWMNTLETKFNKKKKKYVICLEKGNHLQIAYATEERSNNARSMITKLLKFVPGDDAERQTWLKIKSHNNPKYLLGYCTKENIPANVLTNYEPEVLAEAVAYYEVQKVRGVNLAKGDWICTSINTLIPYAYAYGIENNLITKDVQLKAICIMMFGDGLVPLSLCEKMRPTTNDYWNQYMLVQAGASHAERWQSAQTYTC